MTGDAVGVLTPLERLRRVQADVLGLRCLRCNRIVETPAPWLGCQNCRDVGMPSNLTVALRLTVRPDGQDGDPAARLRTDMWRFGGLLPVRAGEAVSLCEGSTPLLHLDRFGARSGLRRLYAKDESRNPTWSYKDRLATVAVTHALSRGARVITASSTGNHGASTAAYAARAGLASVIFTLDQVPQSMKVLMQAYGAALVVCETSEQRWRLMEEGVDRLGWYPTGNYLSPPIGSNPYGVEGYKTLAYEVVESLGWVAPDVVVVPTGHGDGLYGIYKGMAELEQLGIIKQVPRMVAAEVFGSLADALASSREVPRTMTGLPSAAFSIATPSSTYQALEAIRKSRGTAVPVTDEGVFESQRRLAREQSLFVEPSSAAALQAALQLRSQHAVDEDTVVVVVLTSGGLKDPTGAATWLPEPVRAAPTLDETIRRLEKGYDKDLRGR